MGGDGDLVLRLRTGDAVAFAEVYARYRARLLGFLARMTREPALAEDLLQETWLRLAAAAPRLAPDSDLGAWVFTVARNVQASHRRWRLLDGRRRGLAASGASAEDPHGPHAHAEAGEARRRLEVAVGALPPADREVLLLVSVERLEPGQAAAVLGISAEAARQRLARARAALRAALDGGDA
ncbi:MAG: sigma-70 family RNA polymerase sigma factor [Anaeromyxobacter sp.]